MLKSAPTFIFAVLASVSSYSQGWTLSGSNLTTPSKVGVGTTSPNAPLVVSANVTETGIFEGLSSGNTWLKVKNSVGAVHLGIGGINPNAYLWSTTDNLFIGSDVSTPTFFVRGMANGSVGIGTTQTGTNRLAVEGTIAARRLVLTLANPWPDYVFAPEYNLPSIAELERYILVYKHLPGISSAAEIEKDGLDVGSNQASLLQKIEELTLYLIQKDKQVAELTKRLEKLEKSK